MEGVSSEGEKEKEREDGLRMLIPTRSLWAVLLCIDTPAAIVLPGCVFFTICCCQDSQEFICEP
jgi:hypothetical protein